MKLSVKSIAEHTIAILTATGILAIIGFFFSYLLKDSDMAPFLTFIIPLIPVIILFTGFTVILLKILRFIKMMAKEQEEDYNELKEKIIALRDQGDKRTEISLQNIKGLVEVSDENMKTITEKLKHLNIEANIKEETSDASQYRISLNKEIGDKYDAWSKKLNSWRNKFKDDSILDERQK